METLGSYETLMPIRVAGGEDLPDVLEFNDGVCPAPSGQNTLSL